MIISSVKNVIPYWSISKYVTNYDKLTLISFLQNKYILYYRYKKYLLMSYSFKFYW